MAKRIVTKYPTSYIKASEAYDELDRFEIEFENIQREWYNTEFYRNTHINLFTYAEGKYPNSIRRAGVNWGAWGTQPPADTKEFAEALLAAAELCETLNNKFPNVKDF